MACPPLIFLGVGGGMCPAQEAETIIQKIKQQQYPDLLAHDQLLQERKDQKVFLHFGESQPGVQKGWKSAGHGWGIPEKTEIDRPQAG